MKPINKKKKREVINMKKNWFKQVVAVGLASVLVVGTLTGCGGKKAGKNDGLSAGGEDVSYPVDTEIELSWFVQAHNSLQTNYMSADESPFHSGLSDVTGIAIDWQFPAAGSDGTATYNMLLQDEELPNIISGAVFGPSEANRLMEAGLIVDLTEYVKKYAPDYWAYISDPAHEAEYKSMLTPDGKLWGFGMFSEKEDNLTYIGPVIRKDWLEECGLKEPVTLNDWENVLKTFKQKYGATFSFSLERYNKGGIASGTGAFANLTSETYIDNDGTIKVANVQNEWREMLEVLNRWYEMGLIDKDFATNTDTTVREKVLRGEVGISITAMSQITVWKEDAQSRNMKSEWIGMEYPRTAKGEPTTFINTRDNLRTDSGAAAVITTGCAENEIIAACKLLNYGFTEEGILYWNYGTEGVSYTISEEGKPVFTDTILKNPLGITEAMKQYTGAWSAGVTIQQLNMVYQKNAPEAVEAVQKWMKNSEARKHITPSLVIDEQYRDEVTDINSKVNTYIEEMALKFVTGQVELNDKNWESFKKRIKDYGDDEATKHYANAYEKYLNIKIER